MNLPLITLLSFVFVSPLAQASPKPPKILIVVAHPDDEYYMAASVYHLAKQKDSVVDQMVITNGEGGYKYSGPAEKIYNKKLTTESIGRRELPAIRKKEVEAAGKILGIRKHFFLNQKDTAFNRDLEASIKSWDSKKVVSEISHQIRSEHYDFLLTLIPTSINHGGHQAATLLTLQAVKQLDTKDRPVVLAAFTTSDQPLSTDSDQYKDQAAALAFKSLADHSETTIATDSPVLKFDRNKSIEPSQPKLTYQIIVNWMIAEHKSQGMFQNNASRDDWEQFKLFELGAPDGAEKAKGLL